MMVHMRTSCLLLLLLIVAVAAAADGVIPLETLKSQMNSRFKAALPQQWGEQVSGVRSHLATKEKLLALTLDACGSARGKGFDAELITYLEQEQIPATLFINARWIDANPETFLKLSRNPLFEIANHGLHHKPASITGRSVYGIAGTRSVVELTDEIELNARKIESLTGRRPLLYRSGTAYYDDVAVQISNALGHEVAGYSVLGDAGATYSATQVTRALLASKPGDVILCHFNHPESGTAVGIRGAIPELKRRGYRFVQMSPYLLQNRPR